MLTFQVNFKTLDCELDLNSSNLDFKGHLKYLAIENLLERGPDSQAPPSYFFVSRAAEGENLLDIKFSWVDFQSRKLYKNGTKKE